MPIARINDQLVLFIHVTKTGGETTEKYLQNVSDGQARLSLLRRPNPNLLPCSPQHLHADPLEYLFRPKFFDYAFTIVRDPIARLISEYNFRAGPRHAKGQHIPTFPVWWRRMRTAYTKNQYVSDNHIRPQTDFLTPRIAQKFDVFRFEDGLTNVLKKVFASLDLAFVDLEIHTHRSTGIPVEVDEETFESIASFYSGDLARFGYSVEQLKDQHLSINPAVPSKKV